MLPDLPIRDVLPALGSALTRGHAVLAAGAWSRTVAGTVGLALPVHARRRTVFVFSCPTPLTDCNSRITTSSTNQESSSGVIVGEAAA